MKKLIPHGSALFTPFFDEDLLFPSFSGIQSLTSFPKVDMKETKKEIVVKADIPEFDKGDISLKVQDNKLIISGVKVEEKEEEDKEDRYFLKERECKEIHREINLPKSVDPTKVTAKMKNGVLTVKMVKKSVSEEIEIKVE